MWRYFLGPSREPVGGLSRTGVHLGAFLGSDFGVDIGANFGGLFEVMLYGVLHIDNSLAFPTLQSYSILDQILQYYLNNNAEVHLLKHFT